MGTVKILNINKLIQTPNVGTHPTLQWWALNSYNNVLKISEKVTWYPISHTVKCFINDFAFYNELRAQCLYEINNYIKLLKKANMTNYKVEFYSYLN